MSALGCSHEIPAGKMPASTSGGTPDATLQFQQHPLPIQSTCEAAEAAVLANDSMAGNDYRKRIPAGGGSGGANGVGRAGALREFGVGHGPAKWDPRDLFPYRALESRADRAERQREFFPFTRKIFLELLRCLAQDRMPGISLPLFAGRWDMVASCKINTGQRRVIGYQHQLAHWTVDD